MAEVNYIRHLNAVFEQFRKDSRLNPTHISLYMALFQLWNHNRFRKSFHINRDDVMKLSKIGSKSTYHRNLKELTYYNYIVYNPSHNPLKGSTIKMLKFETSIGQVVNSAVPNQGQAVGRSNKYIQTTQNRYKLPKPKDLKEAIQFFKKANWPEIEAEKFFNHYQSIGWKIGGKVKIEDWQASAKNWMLKAEELQIEKQQKELSQNRDNLHTIRNKNYNEPL